MKPPLWKETSRGGSGVVGACVVLVALTTLATDDVGDSENGDVTDEDECKGKADDDGNNATPRSSILSAL